MLAYLRGLPSLPPAAFAIVMSTGTLACATRAQAQAFAWMDIPAWFLCWLNLAIFAFLCPYALLSWLRHRAELKQACALPGQAAFLSTSGIALLVLANQCLFFDFGPIAAFCFWLAGAITTFGLNLGILYRTFAHKHELIHITPVFFIPVVGLVVIPAAGSALSAGLAQPWEGIVQLVCVLALGAGLLLYSGLFAAMLQRHLLLEPLPDLLTPTLWIHLAPLGWGSISLLALGHVLATDSTQETLAFLALLGWGAAAWWVIMAGILTVRALTRRSLKISMAWWSFIFPLGSFTLLTRLLAIEFGAIITFAVWLLMSLIWLAAIYGTLRLACHALAQRTHLANSQKYD